MLVLAIKPFMILIPPSIVKKFYRKDIVANFFTKKLSCTRYNHTHTLDLVATISEYFDMNTGVTKMEANHTAEKIHLFIFTVSKLAGIIFR